MAKPVEYNGAMIYLRLTTNGWYSDWGWLDKKTIRFPGGWSKHPQVATLKAKQTIDATIAKNDISVRWFSMKLIEG